MCILCVIQKWSRRVATMLPWLVIPLIGLWALSQLLPPAFRFEVTSPRLACVFVLLVTLFWYEVLMPRLSAWRVRRNARLREKKRFEAIELQKLRKTATRRCRNCLTPYRDQNPGGGRFMCSYCGHISKRPVLDLPVPPGLGLTNSQILKELVGRGGRILNGKVWADSGWVCGQEWLDNGNWVGGSFAAKSSYWRKDGGGFFGGDDHCMAEKSYSRFIIFSCKVLTAFFTSIRWFWRKITRVSSSEDDASMDADHRGILLKRGENGSNFHESRVEKARRKAEEKRQARLERELLEEEERKQREEVARLVEERRKLRDEKMEAERNRGRGVAIAREKDCKKEAEKKRQERRKEKDKASNKSNSDVEEVERRIGKENERKRDLDRKVDNDRREYHRTAEESAKVHSIDSGHGFKGATMHNHSRGNAGTRYFDRMRGTLLSSSKAFSGGSFFGRGTSTSWTVLRENKPNGSIDNVQTSVNRRELLQPNRASAKPSINGDEKNLSRPVLVEPQPRATLKKSWQQLFTRSSTVPPPISSNVISRPIGKGQTDSQSPPYLGHSSSTHSYSNPINFGLPSPFTLPTFSNISTSSSTVIPLSSDVMFPRIREHCEILPEESDIFEDPCYVPDPVTLLGPVSESLNNFQLDLGSGFANDLALDKSRALKNISASSEVTRPSPIESPLSRLRISEERHSSSNRFPGTPKIQDRYTVPVDNLSNANETGTWQMWNSSPLGQDGLSFVGGPGSWLSPLEPNRSNKEDFVHPIAHSTMSSTFTKDDKALSGIHSSPNAFFGTGQNGGSFGTPVAGSIAEPWLPKTSQQNEMIYASSNGSAINHPYELSTGNCWARKEWGASVQGGGGSGSGNTTTSSSSTRTTTNVVGGLYSTPAADVQSLW